MTRSPSPIAALPALTLLGALLGVAGCASAPKPTADLAQAHSLVDQAEQSGAAQFASADLASARSKLSEADQSERKQPEQSTRLAQEATVDARVALARTNALKAEQSLHDVDAGLQTLQSETDRSQSGATTVPRATTMPGGTTLQ